MSVPASVALALRLGGNVGLKRNERGNGRTDRSGRGAHDLKPLKPIQGMLVAAKG